MDLADVMDEVAARLDTIDGLRVHAFPADNVSPPAACVVYPETYTYDQTMRRGMDRMTLPVLVFVGRPHDRSSRDRLARYLNGAGSSSVKQVLEVGSWTSADRVRVMEADVDVVQVAGTDYLTASFDLDITGQGGA